RSGPAPALFSSTPGCRGCPGSVPAAAGQTDRRTAAVPPGPSRRPWLPSGRHRRARARSGSTRRRPSLACPPSTWLGAGPELAGVAIDEARLIVGGDRLLDPLGRHVHRQVG